MAKDPKVLFEKLDSDVFGPGPGECVYAVFVRNMFFYSGSPHLVYIGSTINLIKRRSMKNHPYSKCRERLGNGRVFTLYLYSKDYLEDEKILIKHFKPIFNKMHK